jgi:bifunctional UDP-N-acetylglucosamine pyrophosphorylase/glucosamine-1-phosphate N-acetyltransferase
MRAKVAGVIENDVTFKGSVFIEEGAVIKSGTCIEGPTYCGRGTRVGPNARVRPFTSLEKDVAIGASCDIKNSIVMRGTKIPHLSYVGDSIIGEECNLGAGTITANVRFDKHEIRMAVKGHVTSTSRVKLGVIMGDRVQTGINVSILPGIRIGSGSWIGPGALVSKDVSSGKLLIVTQGHKMRSSRIPK